MTLAFIAQSAGLGQHVARSVECFAQTSFNTKSF
jgi:hypothetical protein